MGDGTLRHKAPRDGSSIQTPREFVFSLATAEECDVIITERDLSLSHPYPEVDRMLTDAPCGYSLSDLTASTDMKHAATADVRCLADDHDSRRLSSTEAE